MLKFVVGGQMDKQVLADLLKKHGGDVSVEVKSDLDAVVQLQSNAADYYFGACATGAGGALGLALGILGPTVCATVSMPGKVLSDEEIGKVVSEGKKAFGFVNSDAEKVIPVLLKYIFDKQ